MKGHNQNKGNEEADKLTSEDAKKLMNDEIDLSISDPFNLQGARLAKITQALAYQHIAHSPHHHYYYRPTLIFPYFS
jgi:hypothetical protein